MKTIYLLLVLVTLLISVQAELYLGTDAKDSSRHFIGTTETIYSRDNF